MRNLPIFINFFISFFVIGKNEAIFSISEIEQEIFLFYSKLSENKRFFEEIKKEGNGKIEEFMEKAKIDKNGAFLRLMEMQRFAQNKNNEERINLKRQLDKNGTKKLLGSLVENDVRKLLGEFARKFGEMDDSIQIGEETGKGWTEKFKNLEINLKLVQSFTGELCENWLKVHKTDDEFKEAENRRIKLDLKFEREKNKIKGKMVENVEMAAKFGKPLECARSTLNDFLMLYKFKIGTDVLVNEKVNSCRTDWVNPLKAEMQSKLAEQLKKGERREIKGLKWPIVKIDAMEGGLNKVKGWLDKILEKLPGSDLNVARGRMSGQEYMTRENNKFLTQLFKLQ